MQKEQLPITCPLCGRKSNFSLEGLLEGSTLSCPFCKVKLKLHGHMWEYLRAEIKKLKDEN